MKKLLAMLLMVTLALSINIPVYAAVSDTGFTDVNNSAWYAEAVIYCQDNDLMSGTTATTFAPNASMTRAMLATVLYRIAGSPQGNADNPFSDVTTGNWYADAVLWAQQNDIVSGYGSGQFGTNDPVTREQIAAILWRNEGRPQPGNAADFSDETRISSWAVDAVEWARENKIMNGKNGNQFDPKSNVTRAEVATILMNYLQDGSAKSNQGTTGTLKEGKKILIAYFSLMGNADYGNDVDTNTSASIVVENGEQIGTTERIAKMIQKQVGGDIHLIETKVAYPINFNDVVSQNHKESDAGTRPELASTVDVAEYDVIFIGYPVWASSVPTPVLSFLEGADLNGKTVIPFCTHDGYGAGSSYSTIARASEGANVEQGLDIESTHADSAQNSVETWLNSLNLPEKSAQSNVQQSQGETPITLAIGNVKLDGVLYDNPMAQEFITWLPNTVTMGSFGDREYYGRASDRIAPVGDGQLRFNNGDITYCPSNNTLAIFYAQTDHPNLTMEVYPIGRVTSDLSIFDTLDSSITVTFERVK